MLFFDPTDARLERASKKEQIEISVGYSRHYTFDEDGPKLFRFWFIERSLSQMQNDYFKEDGIYARYKIQL